MEGKSDPFGRDAIRDSGVEIRAGAQQLMQLRSVALSRPSLFFFLPFFGNWLGTDGSCEPEEAQSKTTTQRSFSDFSRIVPSP